jgi:hypothetical protein
MNKSYLLVKNSLATTVNGSLVSRNVGFGCAFSQDQIWEYPSSCQIRSASLKIGGQQVEYVEDVNIRVVNQAIYEKNHEQIRREANVGGYTFQRLETGSKSASPADPAVVVRSQGLQMSAFLDETITAPAGANTYAKTGSGYKVVSCAIPLRDLFKFCDSPQAADLFVGGTATQEIVVELQFEDRNQLLCEYVNLAADVTSVPGTPRPKQFETLAITPASVRNADGTNPPTVQATLLASIYQATTVASYSHVTQVPLYVGQPICLWLAGALPAVVGSNYSIVQSISVAVGGGVATIVFRPYTVDDVAFLRAGGAQITPAQYFANVYAGGAGVLTAISGVPDPVLTAGANSVLTAIDAGLNTKYSVEGLEMVMVEKNTKGQKQTINYISYMRDTDTIPTGQLTYAKSFQIDPNCAGLFCCFPPKRTAGSAQTNMLSLSHHAGVSEGLSYRNMIDNQQLYSRDITFSSATEAVEPLYLERLNLTAMGLGMSLKNLSPVAHMIAKNGITAHAIISEPVEMKTVPQQLNLRMTFNVNASDRTIYVYKAIMSQITL